MKKIVFITAVIIACLGCGGTDESAFEYNTKLSMQNDRVVDAVSAFFAEMEHDNYSNAEIERQRIIKVCDSVTLDMKKIGAFEGEDKLLNVLIDYVEAQKILAQQEYKQLIQVNNTIDEIDNVTGEPNLNAIAKAYLAKDSIDTNIDSIDNLHYQKAIATQKKFALKHGFRIEEAPELPQDAEVAP